MRALLLLTVLLLAGCAGERVGEPEPPAPGPTAPAGPSPAATPGEDYVFVLVTGDLEIDHPGDRVGVCGYPSPPEVDRARQAVHFHNERFDLADTQALGISLVWDHSLCGTMETRVAPSPARDRLVIPLPVGEALEVRIQEDAWIDVAGVVLAPGEALPLSREGRTADGHPYALQLRVEAHGLWPKANATFAPSTEMQTS